MLGKLIRNILVNDTDVSAIVGTNVYPQMAIEDVPYPYIIIEKEGHQASDTKDGKSCLDVIDYQIIIFSETNAEISDLGIKVRNALDRYAGTLEGLEVQSTKFLAEDLQYSDTDRVYGLGQQYSFRYLTIYNTLTRITDLAGSYASSTQINLTWSDLATGESGYEVWRTYDMESWNLVTTTSANATSYSDTGLTASTAYIYKIRPTDGTNGGQWSNIISVSTDGTGVAELNVSNSNDSYNVDITENLELPDITFTDSDGVAAIVPSMENITATLCEVKSGIAYPYLSLTGQKVSYRANDDGANMVAGVYSRTNPTYPLYYAQLDYTHASPFVTLINNNSFGNKDRFTDVNGLQVYSDNLVIDHLRGLMYYKILSEGNGLVDWNDAIDFANVSTQGGFTDWRLTNQHEMDNLLDMSITNGRTLNYAPFYINHTSNQITSTTAANSLYYMSTNPIWGSVNISLKTTVGYYFLVRNY
ncbi:MAG: DUF3168 domain-containing protein [Proteobacteria bacterium]|nr:DUF3168 domain-containing protein [Pseudomonadota bacterium]